MLVLSRKAGEEIVIGGSICVKVIEVRGNRVRLGITAPDNVPVHRREIADVIEFELAAESAAELGPY